MITSSNEFFWTDVVDDSFFDSPKMLKMNVNEANLQPRVGIKLFKENIKKVRLTSCGNDAVAMLTDIKKNHEGIVEVRENHDNLIKYDFDYLLIFSNTGFYQNV